MGGLPSPPGPVEREEGTPDGPIGRVQAHLDHLAAGVQRSVRHSRRTSWFAWGFLIAALAGVPLFEFGLFALALEFHLAVEAGFALLLVGGVPAFGLLGLTGRELWIGRSEARQYRRWDGAGPSGGKATGFAVSLGTVQESQKQISQIKGELEVSMLPLAFGGIALFEIVGAVGVQLFAAGSVNRIGGGSNFLILVVPALVAIAAIPMVWAFWRLARQWVAVYQRGLDEQVRQMISLEGEFLGRFAREPEGA